MTFSLTATAEPTNSPPRIRLDILESDTANTISSLELFRDGVPLRFSPVIAGGVAIAYDYDAPFDVALTYRADGVEAGVTVDWTEAWASLASWLSPPSGGAATGWSVSGGVASSTVSDAVIYRDSSGTIGRVVVVSPSNVTLQITDSAAVVLASVRTSPDGTVTVTGSNAGQTVTGTGGYTVNLAAASMSVEGTGWSATVNFAGTPTRVRLVGPPSAAYTSKFGTYGTGDGQLNQPQGIALDGSGNIFVVEQGNNRVQKFNSSGTYQSQFGSAGTGNGQFDEPRGIAIDGSGNIFVTDSFNHRVQKFNSAGVYQSQFGTYGTGNGQFANPNGIAIDGSGNIFVVDQQNHRVQKFNSAGVYQSQFGTNGTGNGQFAFPAGIAIDTATGNMWVADFANSRVQKFNSAGVYQSQFGTYGTGNGQFANPNGIALDASLNIWVSDAAVTHRVQKFNSSGVYQGQFGSAGTGNGQFFVPSGIAITGSTVYVADSVNDRVQKFTTAAGSVDDVTLYKTSSTIDVTATDTETLSPTGDYAGVWLTNAAAPDLALIAEAEPSSGDDPYFIVPSTRETSALQANTVALPIEGSAEVVTVVLGPRRQEVWTLDIACTTQVAYKALIALLADSAAINLRFPSTDRWIGLDGGFYAVGDVETNRRGHPQLGPVVIVSLPLTPSRAPAYQPLWQWNMRTLAQTGMTMADVNNAYATMRELLIGPA